MLNGKRRLTVEQAYTFGQLFNTKGKFFIDIQNKNEWSQFVSVKSASQSNVRLEDYL
jgi:plasmid maintenance system antidote protein VapI